MFFLLNARPTTRLSTLSLHDALPISSLQFQSRDVFREIDQLIDRDQLTAAEIQRLGSRELVTINQRSEEHTSELQSRQYLVCRLLLEKKKKQRTNVTCTKSPLAQLET